MVIQIKCAKSDVNTLIKLRRIINGIRNQDERRRNTARG